MSNEEELDIAGLDKPIDKSGDQSPDPDDKINQMDTHVANLKGLVAPGDDAEEFIQMIKSIKWILMSPT